MRLVPFIVFLAACGPGLPAAKRPDPRIAGRERLASRDPALFEELVRGPVVSGGLWFHDAKCSEFNAPGEIAAARRSAFARCLATLGMRPSQREDALGDVVVMEYGAGFEIEARVVSEHDGPRLTWIGFEARRDASDGLPTVSSTTLLALRTAASLPEELEPNVFTWLKVCIDDTGAVVTADVRETSSVHAADAFRDAVMKWQFKPFVTNGQPMPVCSMVRLSNGQPVTPEVLPPPATPSRSYLQPITVSPTSQLFEGRRIAGNKALAPDDIEKQAMAEANISRAEGTFRVCLDPAGNVESVLPLRSTGLAGYDRKILAGIHEWRYTPLTIDGRPTPVCTAVTFVYTQTGGPVIRRH